ncbi:hypothetical protein K450DRAFT_256753 [Umbelopsis ramanniana AG]|uniref:Uncharacterized protein n=1 Tax=Umbelopsis ramanniana AG TaxID=1314678 RepID=A0AAD5H9R1_UMBRA|nr:uncharacterized protein K450DRAFT_256753 [Umbelopsis ramanniana AG]KAI8576435.1 hypothetical protein K450DRAFT_256753 [Umbelopsis ramanniana AG]
MATTAIDYYRDTNVMIADDNRRISQQSIPSLSTTSTDTSTSIDTSRPKSAGPPRVDRRHTRSPSPSGSGGGYLYQTNDFQPWPMYQQQYRGYYSPFYPHMYGVAPQPLINFQDPSMQPMQYKPTSSPKLKKCYMYEPIMPVPLAAVTMEANSMPEDYDYDDNIPLAYFKRMGSGGVTNKPHTTKKKGTSPALSSSSSSPTLSSTTEVRPGPISRSRTAQEMKTEPPIKKLARSYTTTTAQQSRPPVKTTEKLPKKQRPKPSPPASPKSKELKSSNNEKSDSGSNSSISSPKWVSRFQAGMARIRLKSVKSM